MVPCEDSTGMGNRPQKNRKKDTSFYLERRYTQGGQSHVKTTQKRGWLINLVLNGESQSIYLNMGGKIPTE
jgi:hypothetical protein